MKKKFFLFLDYNEEEHYTKNNPPYFGTDTEAEARRISSAWHGDNGLWMECEVDEGDNIIEMEPRPDIELLNSKFTNTNLYSFREGDLANGPGSHLGTYDEYHIQDALNHIKAYLGSVHFEYESAFISDQELIEFIVKSKETIIITTNNYSTIYIEPSQLNFPTYDQIF